MNRVTLAALTLVCVASPALADVAATVAVDPAAANPAIVIPYGEYIAGAGQVANSVVVPTLAAVIMWYIRKVAPWATLFLSQQRIEAAVQNVTSYGLNAVQHATKDGKLTVPVGSAVIAQAVQRGIDAVPKKVMDAAGGPAGLAERVFRSLHLDENATAESVLGPVFAQIRAGELSNGAK